jgi:hypothetical protein
MRSKPRRRLMPNQQEMLFAAKELVVQGRLEPEEMALIESHLDEWLKESQHILRHFRGLLAIWAVQVSLFLPLGMISRVSYVLVNRAISRLNHSGPAHIHNNRVLVFCLLPSVGYFAYLIPLREKHPLLVLILAEAFSKKIHGKSYSQTINALPKSLQKALGHLIPPKSEAVS